MKPKSVLSQVREPRHVQALDLRACTSWRISAEIGVALAGRSVGAAGRLRWGPRRGCDGRLRRLGRLRRWRCRCDGRPGGSASREGEDVVLFSLPYVDTDEWSGPQTGFGAVLWSVLAILVLVQKERLLRNAERNCASFPCGAADGRFGKHIVVAIVEIGLVDVGALVRVDDPPALRNPSAAAIDTAKGYAETLVELIANAKARVGTPGGEASHEDHQPDYSSRSHALSPGWNGMK